MTDRTPGPIFARYRVTRTGEQPQAQTDIGIAYEAVEAAICALDELASLILYDTDHLGRVGRMQDRAQIDALRFQGFASRNGFTALCAIARVFNRVEDGGPSFFASDRQMFDGGQGLKLAHGNMRLVSQHLSGLAAALTTVAETSQPFGEPEDVSWWKQEHKKRHEAATRNAGIANERLEAAIHSLDDERSKPTNMRPDASR